MSISSEIQRINTNIANAYIACENKGATLPASQTSGNLASCINSITTGGGSSSPVITSLTITPSTTSQTIIAPSGTDGYSPISVSPVTNSIDSNITAGNIKKNVNILGVTGTYEGSGGGGTPPYTQYAYPELVNKNCYVLGNYSNVIPISFKGSYTRINGLTSGQYDIMTIVEFMEGFGIEVYQDFTLEPSYINNGWTSLTIQNTTNTLPSDYWAIDSQNYVTHINLNFENYCRTGAIKFQNKALGRNSELQTVRIRNMSNLILGNAFYDCAYLREVDVSMIDSMPNASALGGTASVGGAFTNCFSLRSLSFNSLKSTSFGSATSQFNNMLSGVTGCTVHFPSNLQSVIGSWDSVTTGFGGTNTTVLFDLPATA